MPLVPGGEGFGTPTTSAVVVVASRVPDSSRISTWLTSAAATRSVVAAIGPSPLRNATASGRIEGGSRRYTTLSPRPPPSDAGPPVVARNQAAWSLKATSKTAPSTLTALPGSPVRGSTDCTRDRAGPVVPSRIATQRRPNPAVTERTGPGGTVRVGSGAGGAGATVPGGGAVSTNGSSRRAITNTAAVRTTNTTAAAARASGR